MFGNINLLLGSVALAVVITTLFVAGNTMAMSVRERTMEIAVMRTLGFQSATIFLLIAGEGLLMALGGGLLGALLARLLVNPGFFPSGGFIPEITVNNSQRGDRCRTQRRHRHRRRGDSGDDGFAAQDRRCAAARRVSHRTTWG